MSDQYELAERLLDEMETSGTSERDVTPLDILDDLACAGLELTDGQAAVEAYHEFISTQKRPV